MEKSILNYAKHKLKLEVEVMKILNYLKGLFWVILWIVLLSLWVALFRYYRILSANGLKYAYLVIPMIALIIGGFSVGRKTNEKGYLESIKIGLIYLVIVSILSFLVFKEPFQIKVIVYDIILLLTAMLGSMIGINFKKRA